MAQLSSIQVIMLDWGDSLVRVPGLSTDETGHVACLKAFFETDLPRSRGSHHDSAPLTWAVFRRCYLEVAQEQMQRSRRTGREHSFDERLGKALNKAGDTRSYSLAELRQMADALANRLAAWCTPIDGAADALGKLASRYALGLLSNYPHPEVVASTLTQFGLRRYLDPVLVSGEIGWAKPHARAFEACLTHIGCRPENVLFVGDDPDTDMRGAHETGFRTCWIVRESGPPPAHDVDFQVRCVTELPAVLKCHARSDGANGP